MNAVEWSPTEVFEISGFELETMVNILATRLSNPEAQKIIKEYDTFRSLQQRIQEGITSGKVKVKEDDPEIIQSNYTDK